MYPEKDQKLRELQRNSTGMGYEAQLEIQHLCCLMILGVMPLCHVMPRYAAQYFLGMIMIYHNISHSVGIPVNQPTE
jgi:hypothetical protein